ncbi:MULTISPECIES: bifunctional enoyl-CoA hydratase/phosphate acetyltransferase [Hyphomicrobiales]|uniref:bifunctional enoyl-CoA hydratase/phosphate acetyltransferase n=1 Tax=Hyphomicrobiales TaxID=356 RepID=UPI00055B2F20|nr:MULTISPECIES: bifunctional enoyl-CoA hydratase/phosphate acetyltransferase [Hyphomicrobiales]MBS7740449.1 bifunctional enoyl-CoA hydratase/phosphate acetyltransferase [Chelatococcus sp. HY11]MBX3544767.1 bifunctional enoyl-CoA hydratase/phosphate acetyltransferase [Chelatococcus sp.]MCO5078309.1 bifunctional enoyl-CoA hydratase/phosphate acetyltransferase [Chelatococcus sp.]
MFINTEADLDQSLLRNRTFDDLTIGESASLVRVVGRDDIDLFATVSGDVNPAHLDPVFASTDIFGHIVAHGMWTGALVSAVLGTKLPGPGTIYLEQDLRFRKPVSPGDTITVTVIVREKWPEQRIVVLDTRCANQRGEEVLNGSATVIAPDRTVEWPRAKLPDVALVRRHRYEHFVNEARALPVLKAAIVHPCSPDAILAAVELRNEGLLEPLLVGPEAKIRAAAEEAGVSLDGIPIEAVEHSHAAAARAVELAAGGRVATLMKGSLHTDELLGAVIAENSGLRTDRRVSHVYAMSVPAYSKPLVVTDAAINIQPTLDHKRDICQNAVDLLHTLGVVEPLVAVLTAVETVNSRMPSTLDAAALTVMAARGQITGARVDGPLAFDNAINSDAARTKGIISPVAGQADILLVPDLEAGNMLAKQLIYFGGADAAGLVLGARVPIILTSRADSLRTRIASAALAKLVAFRRSQEVKPA